MPTSSSRGVSQAKDTKKGESPPAVLNRKTIDTFEHVAAQLVALKGEFAAQAKGKPDNAINKFKLSAVNEQLRRANTILPGALRPFADFEEFDIDEMPSNSDVAVVLAAYIAALERWRSANVHMMQGTYRWTTSDGSVVGARGPSSFRQEEP